MTRINGRNRPRRQPERKQRGKKSQGRPATKERRAIRKQQKLARLTKAKEINTISKSEFEGSLKALGLSNHAKEAKETESFVAIAHSALSKIDADISSLFSKLVRRKSKRTQRKGLSYPIFRAGKRAFRKLLNMQELDRATAKEVRKLAGGLAQLDDNKVDLRGTAKIEDGKTLSDVVMDHMSENKKLTDAEYEQLKEHNKAMRAEKSSAVDTSGEVDTDVVTTGQDPIHDIPSAPVDETAEEKPDLTVVTTDKDEIVDLIRAPIDHNDQVKPDLEVLSTDEDLVSELPTL